MFRIPTLTDFNSSTDSLPDFIILSVLSEKQKSPIFYVVLNAGFVFHFLSIKLVRLSHHSAAVMS